MPWPASVRPCAGRPFGANLFDALTDLGHAIAAEGEQMDALDLIAPDMYSNENFRSRIISWLLDPSAHHRQAGQFIAALLRESCRV